jgi:hypothetical protein
MRTHKDKVLRRDALIRDMFMQNFTAPEMCLLLKRCHGLPVGLSTVKSTLRRLNLKKREYDTDEVVVGAILKEIETSGILLGYRSMWTRLRVTYNIRTTQANVLHILNVLTPEAVQARKKRRLQRRKYRSKGPNFLIHVDGYDKLKPYGFCISGAIDGFSRRILWLRVNRTNNNPAVIGGYLIDLIYELEGVPRQIRIDAGTENTIIEAIEIALRSFHTDSVCGDKSVITGKSTGNQRIERYWGSLRGCFSQYYMTLFKDLQDHGAFNNTNDIQVEALRFSFMELLQAELDRVKREWNLHTVRKSTMAQAPPGKPELLFSCPEDIHGDEEYKSYCFPVDMTHVQALDRGMVTRLRKSGTSEEFEQLFKVIMEERDLVMPTTVDEALHLYAFLADRATDLLE